MVLASYVNMEDKWKEWLHLKWKKIQHSLSLILILNEIGVVLRVKWTHCFLFHWKPELEFLVTLKHVTCCRISWSFVFVFPLPPSISGVIPIPLSVVLGVEEDQSESTPAHARHEGGAHHPALRAHQADQENDGRDDRMSTKQRWVEYPRGKLLIRSLKHQQKEERKKRRKTNHINELLHFIWTILWGEICSPPLFFFHRSTWCKILRCWLATKVVLDWPILESQFMLKHRLDSQSRDVSDTDNGPARPTVRQWHKCIKY